MQQRKRVARDARHARGRRRVRALVRMTTDLEDELCRRRGAHAALILKPLAKHEALHALFDVEEGDRLGRAHVGASSARVDEVAVA
eukprot:scaffold229113_cov26-Tisochrysis_lutea.AAC.2